MATITEIYDYLRLLFARVGTPHCWVCGQAIASQTVSQMVDAIFTLPEGTRFMVMAPIIRGQKGQHAEALQHAKREGFVRVRIDGAVHDLKDVPELDKNKKHTIEVVVDRLVLKPTARIRLSDSLETALGLASGLVTVSHEPPREGQLEAANGPGDGDGTEEKPRDNAVDFSTWKDWVFSATYACPQHPEANLPELAPRMFSFNSPYGACESCDGLGTILEFDSELVVPDESLSLTEGAVDAWRHGGKRMNIFYNRLIRRFCKHYGASPTAPWNELDPAVRKVLLYGDDEGGFEGVLPNLQRRWKNTDSEFVKARLHGFLSERPCRDCGGARLKPASLAVTVAAKNINDVSCMSIGEALAW
ncbi:MAG: excinuclease ABC subunit UvrA, partial [Planctomycetota bacterium]|nr:excinuclease ABC subunit UvrA [Planctomycetota bacterium]